MPKQSCIVRVSASVDPEELVPPEALADQFPGWDAWAEGGERRKALEVFVERSLWIAGVPENMYEPSVIESPTEDDWFPMKLESVGLDVVLVCEIPFVFTRQVTEEDLDPFSEFSDEFGSVSGIFGVDWKVGDEEHEYAFSASELFAVTMLPTSKG
jgi:hypothetical protein